MENTKLALLFGNKGSSLCQKLFSVFCRFPDLFPKEIFKIVGGFLSQCEETFISERPLGLLTKILFSFHRFELTAPHERLCFETLKIHPSVFGLSLALFSLQDDEVCHEKHLLRAIQNLISGVKILPGSYLYFHNHQTHFFYLEIEKMRGGVFSFDEMQKLKTHLQLELLKEIESASRSIFLPGTEEELFKNIKHLSREIKYVHDLPQIMIMFVEYVHDTLKFLVISLRLLKQDSDTLASLSSQLPPIVQFSLEKTLYLEKLHKKYPKEASVFTLEMKSLLFANHNQGVNLRMARQYIVKCLENMFGPFRDYNGGLLFTENKQFLSIQRTLDKKGISTSFLEELFYRIKPITMRPLVLVETGAELMSLFHRMVALPLVSKQVYRLETSSLEDVDIAIIKTTEMDWKHSLSHRILSQSDQFVFTYKKIEKHLYLCFFHQHPQKHLLFEAIHEELKKYFSLTKEEQTKVVRLNFQGGDPPSLSPRLASDIHCHILSNLLFEGLTRVNSQDAIEPAIAEKIEISPCRKHYMFHLRPAWWSNGEEITAYHFAKSWKKMLAHPHAIGRHCFSFLDSECILAKNAKTLLVELKLPCSYFLNLLATPPFFPQFGDFEEPTIFNGPFTLAERKPQHSLLLLQNPFYWDAANVKLEGIHISMIRDPQKAYSLFLEKKLDMIGDPMSPLCPEILQSETSIEERDVSRVFWIHCNTSSFPLHNASFRKALNVSINRRRLTERVFIKQNPHLSPLPPKYSQRQEENFEGDVKTARVFLKKALEEFGLTDVKQLPALTITHSDLSFEEDLMMELKNQWEEGLEIDIKIKPLSWVEFSAALERKNYQLGGLFRRDFFYHPMFYLSFFKPSSSNPHSWNHEEYNLLVQRLQRGEDLMTLKSIENLLIEESPVIPLVSQKYLTKTHPRVKGMVWNTNGCLNLKGAWIENL